MSLTLYMHPLTSFCQKVLIAFYENDTPGKPLETFTGTESVRSLGGLWNQAEGRGEMPGGGAPLR